MGLDTDLNALDRIRQRLLETATADKAAVEYADVEKRSTIERVGMVGTDEFTHKQRARNESARGILGDCEVRPAVAGIEQDLWRAAETLAQTLHMLDTLADRVYGPVPMCGNEASDVIETFEPVSMLERLDHVAVRLNISANRALETAHRLANLT